LGKYGSPPKTFKFCGLKKQNTNKKYKKIYLLYIMETLEDVGEVPALYGSHKDG